MDPGMPDVILRWLAYMTSYDVEVIYRPGVDHGNADGLSRPTFHSEICKSKGCICEKCGKSIAKALDAYHGEPEFDACDAVPAFTLGNVQSVTRAQAKKLEDLNLLEIQEQRAVQQQDELLAYVDKELYGAGPLGTNEEQNSDSLEDVPQYATVPKTLNELIEECTEELIESPPVSKEIGGLSERLSTIMEEDDEEHAPDVPDRHYELTSEEEEICNSEDELHDAAEMWEDGGGDLGDFDLSAEAISQVLRELREVTGTWCTLEVAEEQARDPQLAKVRAWVNLGRKPTTVELDREDQVVRKLIATFNMLTVVYGVLCRKGKEGLQVVVSQILRSVMFRHLHANPVQGGHLGRNRTYEKIRARAWWPGYREDISAWVRGCDVCQMQKVGPGRGNQPLVHEESGAPFERVAIDLVGPFQPSPHGMKYLMVAQDYFTKWVEAVPIPNKMAATVADAFVKIWVCRYGPPRCLHQDNGKEFLGVFKQMCSVLGVVRTTTTPYYPRSNGMVERTNQTLQNMLKCLCLETGKGWADMTPFALSAYQASRHESTKLTPNLMMFGHELAAPIDLLYGRGSNVPQCPGEYIQWLNYTLIHVHGRAKQMLRTSMLSQKFYHDRKLKRRDYKVGDKVVYLRPNKRKMLGSWEGVYEVTKVMESRHHYILQNESATKTRRATAEQLRPYHEGVGQAGVHFEMLTEDEGNDGGKEPFCEHETLESDEAVLTRINREIEENVGFADSRGSGNARLASSRGAGNARLASSRGSKQQTLS